MLQKVIYTVVQDFGRIPIVSLDSQIIEAGLVTYELCRGLPLHKANLVKTLTASRGALVSIPWKAKSADCHFHGSAPFSDALYLVISLGLKDSQAIHKISTHVRHVQEHVYQMAL